MKRFQASSKRIGRNNQLTRPIVLEVKTLTCSTGVGFTPEQQHNNNKQVRLRPPVLNPISRWKKQNEGASSGAGKKQKYLPSLPPIAEMEPPTSKAKPRLARLALDGLNTPNKQ